jgi:hypothetical protein
MLTFLLEVACEGVLAEVRLNDVQVFRAKRAEPKTAEARLNPWVLEGANLLVARIEPEGTLNSFSLSLTRDGSALSRYRWDGEVEGWRHRFTVRKAFGRWAWQDAPAAAPSAADRRAILALVKEAHRALAGRDAKALTRLTALSREELGRALGFDPDETAQGQEAFLESLFASRDWSPEAIDFAKLVLTPQAGGRIVTITDAAGKPPLRGAAEGGRVALPMSVARVKGKWTIVR